MKKDTKGKRTLCRNFLICNGLRVPSMPHTEKKPSVLLNQGLLLLPDILSKFLTKNPVLQTGIPTQVLHCLL